MNSEQVYKIISYAVGKNINDGYVSPDDFNNVLMPVAQASYLDFLLGQYQQYRAGMPIAVVEIGQKEKIRNSISPLIYNITLNPNSTTGIAAFPNDFEETDEMFTVYGGLYNIRFVNQPRLSNFVNSSIDSIAENPVYILRHEGFQFYPSNIGAANLSYVRTPPAITYGYVEDSNGVPVYNPATSQNPVWNDYDMMNIIVRALRMVGVNLDYAAVAQYANEIKAVG